MVPNIRTYYLSESERPAIVVAAADVDKLGGPLAKREKKTQAETSKEKEKKSEITR